MGEDFPLLRRRKEQDEAIAGADVEATKPLDVLGQLILAAQAMTNLRLNPDDDWLRPADTKFKIDPTDVAADGALHTDPDWRAGLAPT
jgi:hypothetical protein